MLNKKVLFDGKILGDINKELELYEQELEHKKQQSQENRAQKMRKGSVAKADIQLNEVTRQFNRVVSMKERLNKVDWQDVFLRLKKKNKAPNKIPVVPQESCDSVKSYCCFGLKKFAIPSTFTESVNINTFTRSNEQINDIILKAKNKGLIIFTRLHKISSDSFFMDESDKKYNYHLYRSNKEFYNAFNSLIKGEAGVQIKALLKRAGKFDKFGVYIYGDRISEGNLRKFLNDAISKKRGGEAPLHSKVEEGHFGSEQEYIKCVKKSLGKEESSDTEIKKLLEALKFDVALTNQAILLIKEDSSFSGSIDKFLQRLRAVYPTKSILEEKKKGLAARVWKLTEDKIKENENGEHAIQIAEFLAFFRKAADLNILEEYFGFGRNDLLNSFNLLAKYSLIPSVDEENETNDITLPPILAKGIRKWAKHSYGKKTILETMKEQVSNVLKQAYDDGELLKDFQPIVNLLIKNLDLVKEIDELLLNYLISLNSLGYYREAYKIKKIFDENRLEYGVHAPEFLYASVGVGAIDDRINFDFEKVGIESADCFTIFWSDFITSYFFSNFILFPLNEISVDSSPDCDISKYLKIFLEQAKKYYALNPKYDFHYKYDILDLASILPLIFLYRGEEKFALITLYYIEKTKIENPGLFSYIKPKFRFISFMVHITLAEKNFSKKLKEPLEFKFTQEELFQCLKDIMQKLSNSRYLKEGFSFDEDQGSYYDKALNDYKEPLNTSLSIDYLNQMIGFQSILIQIKMNLFQLNFGQKTIEEVLNEHHILQAKVDETIGLGHKIYVDYLLKILKFIPEEERRSFLSKEIQLIENEKYGVLYDINKKSLGLLKLELEKLSDKENSCPPKEKKARLERSLDVECVDLPILTDRLIPGEDSVIRHVLDGDMKSLAGDITNLAFLKIGIDLEYTDLAKAIEANKDLKDPVGAVTDIASPLIHIAFSLESLIATEGMELIRIFAAPLFSDVISGSQTGKIEPNSKTKEIYEKHFQKIINQHSNYNTIVISLPEILITTNKKKFVMSDSNRLYRKEESFQIKLESSGSVFVKDSERHVNDYNSAIIPANVEGYEVICGPVDKNVKETIKKLKENITGRSSQTKEVKKWFLQEYNTDDCQGVVVYKKIVSTPDSLTLFFLNSDQATVVLNNKGSFDMWFSGYSINISSNYNTTDEEDHKIVNNLTFTSKLTNCTVHNSGTNIFYIGEMRNFSCSLTNSHRQKNKVVTQGGFTDFENIHSVIGSNSSNTIEVSHASYVDGKGGGDYIIVPNNSTIVVKSYPGDIIYQGGLVLLPINFSDIIKITQFKNIIEIIGEGEKHITIDSWAQAETADGFFIKPLVKVDDKSNLVKDLLVSKYINNNITLENGLNDLQKIDNPNFNLTKQLLTTNYDITIGSATFHSNKENHNFYWESNDSIKSYYSFSGEGNQFTIAKANGILDFSLLIGRKKLLPRMLDEGKVEFYDKDLRVILLPGYKMLQLNLIDSTITDFRMEN